MNEEVKESKPRYFCLRYGIDVTNGLKGHVCDIGMGPYGCIQRVLESEVGIVGKDLPDLYRIYMDRLVSRLRNHRFVNGEGSQIASELNFLIHDALTAGFDVGWYVEEAHILKAAHEKYRRRMVKVNSACAADGLLKLIEENGVDLAVIPHTSEVWHSAMR